MIAVRAQFRRLRDISLVDAYDETGVYILWSSKANVRPSYIGEGYVLTRFADHTKKAWATRPLDGCMALLRGGPSVVKSHAELVEGALLAVADEVDRYPRNNAAPGKTWAALSALLRHADHDARVVRITISGQDPLLPPQRPPMQRDKTIVLRGDRNDDWRVDSHDWNRRAR